MKHIIPTIIFAVFIIISLSSCFRYKDIVLFNQSNNIDSTYTPPQDNLIIKSGDLLYFSVYSINDNVNKMFNEDSRFVNYSFNNQALYILGYTVNNKGYINLPFVGNIKVSGLTMDSAETIVSNKIHEYFRDINVKIRFLSYYISIMGEVKRPTRATIVGRQLNIFEALSLAGDMTDFANRQDITIIRQKADNSVEIGKVNLLSDKIFKSKYYNIYPNDVIYVPPLKNKNLRLNAPNISIILSSITTLILVLNFILK